MVCDTGKAGMRNAGNGIDRSEYATDRVVIIKALSDFDNAQ
jgi:hypothetical protein